MNSLLLVIAISSAPPLVSWFPERSLPRTEYDVGYTSAYGFSVGNETHGLSVSIGKYPIRHQHADIYHGSAILPEDTPRQPPSGVPFSPNMLWIARDGHLVVRAVQSGYLIDFSLTGRLISKGRGKVRRPLPTDYASFSEAILREVSARYLGMQLTEVSRVNLGGQSLPRLKNPSTEAELVPLREFAQAVGGSNQENHDTLRFTLGKGSKVFQFAWGTPYAKMGGGWEALPDGVALRNGQLWIPLVAAQRFLSANN